jgi:hypothetical protein
VADNEIAELLGIDPAVISTTADDGYGVTAAGFVPKPFARVVAEKLLLARALFGEDVDLAPGSSLRKLLEISALEDARTWSALAAAYDDSFVATATGAALGRLGEEAGLARPYLEATGRVTLALTGTLPAGTASLSIGRGARMVSEGGHQAATDEPVVLTAAVPQREVPVAAFYPGPDHNLDPAVRTQKLRSWNLAHAALSELADLRAAGVQVDVTIDHAAPLTGGQLQWSDARYRELLLRAPRSLWTADAVRIAASLVPGVRQVQVRDAWGGLDIHQSIFGTAEQDFVERLFTEDEEAASPYRVVVVVAPTPAAIWEGPDGLRAAVAAAIEDVRPLGIFPRIEQADQIGVGLTAEVWAHGLPLGGGSPAAINASAAAYALRARLLDQVRRYVDELGFGEPVRYAEVIAALMEEPGIIDVRSFKLLRFPPGFEGGEPSADPVELPTGANVELQVNQIPVFAGRADDVDRVRVRSR